MPASKPTNIWEGLRQAFDKETVGLLPKVSCYSCAQATKTAKSALDKHCDKHAMSKCPDCGAYITEGHIHLDYVGHAAVTDRLNIVAGPDNWTWEPLAFDERGLPAVDNSGNLWIRLMVREAADRDWVVRLGYGDGSTSMKELIGDALRNAAMRFGIALDLWSKEELESTLSSPELKNEKPSKRQERPGANGPATESQRREVVRVLALRGYETPEAQKAKIEEMGEETPLTVAAASRILDNLKGGVK